MDYMTAGRETLRTLVERFERIDHRHGSPHVFSAGVVDEGRGIYMALSHGWDGKERVKSIQFFVRVVGDKFRVEEDWTKDGVATDLLEAGVPNNKIVLAFHHPSMREYTEFAVA